MFTLDKTLTARLAADFMRAMLINPSAPANDTSLADLAVAHALALQNAIEAAFDPARVGAPELPKETQH
jgi:hypothetical protein